MNSSIILCYHADGHIIAANGTAVVVGYVTSAAIRPESRFAAGVIGHNVFIITGIR